MIAGTLSIYHLPYGTSNIQYTHQVLRLHHTSHAEDHLTQRRGDPDILPQCSGPRRR